MTTHESHSPLLIHACEIKYQTAELEQFCHVAVNCYDMRLKDHSTLDSCKEKLESSSRVIRRFSFACSFTRPSPWA